ncbi:MAG TPA: oxygen-independent coproporphyrinogen III oxidase [Dongiaceae bacterium]|nr:oxygen-independent coproporphyrinogen III oxidase [Dongiaceae bacterium]
MEMLLRYDAPVPRYTSYPTAPHFHAGVDAETYREWLGRLGDGDTLSLYLHVPFCAEMCWYCGCHTKVVRQYRPVGEYARLLEREVALVAAAIPARPAVRHVHWGGGTPNMLSAADFAEVMSAIAGHFHLAADAEVAVEIDPRTLTDDRAAAMAAAGVTRASLGVQDFNPDVQAAVNRVQPFELVRTVVQRLHAAGIHRINFDLMYGLPRQTVEHVARTVDLAAELAPDRLAVFGYAHVPWMKTHQRMIDEAALPGAAERLAQAEAAAARLVGHGYRRIGLDHYARPDDAMTRALDEGRLRRNFQGYTTDPSSALLGFGASAIGALVEGYVQNAVPLRAYGEAVRDGRLAVTRGVRATADDRLRGAVIERLMCDLAVDLTNLGVEPDAFAAELSALAPMRRDGLVEIDGGRLRVTEPGRPLVRTVCAAFDRYLQTGKARHSRAV